MKHLLQTLWVILVLLVGARAQELPMVPTQPTSPTTPSSPFTFELKGQEFTRVISANQLMRAVNPDEYRVDAGDQFIIKIDPPGPSIKIYQAVVTPEGVVLLPEAPSISVKHLVLNQARRRILQVLHRQFPDAEIEVYLVQVHPITVAFASPLPGVGEGQFLSSNRLHSAVEYFLQSWQEAVAQEKSLQLQRSTPSNNEGRYFKAENLDSLFQLPGTVQPALRRVQIIRNGTPHTFDLMRFRFLGDERHNPYLMDNDIVVIPVFRPEKGSITVQGAVGQTTRFEYRPGDRLKEAIAFSGGLATEADSARIQVFRYQKGHPLPPRFELQWPRDSLFALQANDVIIVQYKPRPYTRGVVKIIGEVQYPGEYPIPDNGIRLSEVITRAGGLTAAASLSDARIYRTRFYRGEENLAIYLRLRPQDLDVNIISYLGVRSREEVRVLACDMERLFTQGDSTQDVRIRDGDIIYIPQPIGIVYVSGAVVRPGTYPYRPGWHYEDYIAAAGGYTNLARKRSVRIIRGDTGVWLGRDDQLPIYAGDMIFVPEKTEIRWQTFMKDVAITLGQLATVALIMTRIFGGN